jgi:predicted SAM-dependent methyltransferase
MAELRLDLGANAVKREGYIGIDLAPASDLKWDLTWGIPFGDNRVREIRSDHFFEHLELPAVIFVLKECRRVLVPGGVLDISVPHLDPYLDAYARHDYEFLSAAIYDIPKGQEALYSTCFDRIAWLLHRAGEHKSMFDRESILAKVRLAGFVDVTTRTFSDTRDVNRRFSSVYVVAVK